MLNPDQHNHRPEDSPGNARPANSLGSSVQGDLPALRPEELSDAPFIEAKRCFQLACETSSIDECETLLEQSKNIFGTLPDLSDRELLATQLFRHFDSYSAGSVPQPGNLPVWSLFGETLLDFAKNIFFSNSLEYPYTGQLLRNHFWISLMGEGLSSSELSPVTGTSLYRLPSNPDLLGIWLKETRYWMLGDSKDIDRKIATASILGELMLDSGFLEAAYALFDEVESLLPNDPDSRSYIPATGHLLAGRVYLEKGREESLAAAGKEQLNLSLKHLDQAFSALAAQGDSQPMARCLFYFTCCNYYLGQRSKATEWYNKTSGLLERLLISENDSRQLQALSDLMVKLWKAINFPEIHSF